MTCNLVRPFILFCAFFAWPTLGHSLPADVKAIEKPKALYEIPRKNLYAIGLTDVPAGLITIVNGNIHVARTDGAGKLTVDNSMKTIAEKMAYVVVKSWIEVPLKMKIETATDLSKEISTALKKLGYENARGVPFLLKGKFQRIEAHVTETSKLQGDNMNGIALGLFTKTSVARAEPETYSLVWNFVSDNLTVVGSVDRLTFNDSGHVTLFLPR